MDNPEALAQPPKKLNKKAILIIIAVVITVTFVIVGVTAAVVIIQKQNLASDTETNSTLQNQNETTTPTSYSESTQTTETQSQTQVLGNITFEFTTPEYIGTEILYTVNTQSLNYNANDNLEDKSFNIYLAGEVTQGNLSNGDTQLDLAGYPYYVAVDPEYPNGYFGGGDFSYYLRYIQLDNQSDKIILDGYIGNSIETNNLMPAFTFTMAESLATFEKPYENYYTGTENNGYRLTGFRGTRFADTAGQMVDTVGDMDIYIDNTDSRIMYTSSEDGFLYGINYYPYLINPNSSENFEPIPQITWLDGSQNSKAYDYISIGGCSAGLTGLEVVTGADLQNLIVTGQDVNGNNIYEYQNGQNAFLEKLYNEDYVYTFYKYNGDNNDDVAPYSYSVILTLHPLFVWEDSFGRMIRFANRDYVMTGGCAKPIVYLYPTEQTQLNVQVIPNGTLTFSYPKYPSNGWDVIANPDGKINYQGKDYKYLWWESQNRDTLQLPKSGFIVNKENLHAFFEQKLNHIGLNQQEIKDFTEYWVNKMSNDSAENFAVSFLINEEVNQISQLKFNKSIDTLIRVFMVYTPVTAQNAFEKLNLKEQVLPHFERTGFTVVEWGGAKN